MSVCKEGFWIHFSEKLNIILRVFCPYYKVIVYVLCSKFWAYCLVKNLTIILWRFPKSFLSSARDLLTSIRDTDVQVKEQFEDRLNQPVSPLWRKPWTPLQYHMAVKDNQLSHGQGYGRWSKYCGITLLSLPWKAYAWEPERSLWQAVKSQIQAEQSRLHPGPCFCVQG